MASSTTGSGTPIDITSFNQPSAVGAFDLKGSASITPQGALQLTPNNYSQSGTAVLDKPISSQNGVSVSFTYTSSGGSAGHVGDGLSFFLLDADKAGSAKAVTPGGNGAGLAYSPNGSQHGVTDGFIGVGFDTFGNNAGAPNSVDVRGQGNGTTGYSRLASAPLPGGADGTHDVRIDVVNLSANQEQVTVYESATPGGKMKRVLTTTVNQPLPANYLLGLGGSTGAATDTHSVSAFSAANYDVINGPIDGNATIQGTSGPDIINAFGYNNNVFANGGDDIINAGDGNATVDAATGNVAINLKGYNDVVTGKNGDDTVSGSQGNLSVTLGDGDDSVSTKGYSNIITLGNGDDTVVAGQGNSTVMLGNGRDNVTIAGYSNLVKAGDGNDIVKGGDGNAVITLGNGDNSVMTSGYSNAIKVGSGTNTVTTGAGNANVTAGAGKDSITLGGTNNTVVLNGSSGSVSGGQGNDSVSVHGSGKAGESLTFAGSNSRASIDGTAIVSITDLASALRIDVGSNTQTDTITGFGSKDTSGVVNLTGGAGGYNSVSDIVSALRDDGRGGTILSLGNSGSIDFAGTAKSQLHASNFQITAASHSG